MIIFPLRCDVCGNAILDSAQGVLGWVIDTKTFRAIDFKIIHRSFYGPKGNQCCDYTFAQEKGYERGELSLCEAIGPGGLVELLDILQGGSSEISVLAEVIKRLHVPGYDRARFRWKENDGAIN